jgi:hypothetical protein
VRAIEQHIAPGYEAVCGTKHNIALENSKVITTNNRYVPGHFLRIRPWRGGGGGGGGWGIYKKEPYYTECREMPDGYW